MSKLPDSLKQLRPYIMRAYETENYYPLVSYYCYKYAAQLGVQIVKQTQDQQARQYILSLMDSAEKFKNQLPSDNESRMQFEDFVTQVFCQADIEDRQATPTVEIAKKFLICSHFIEVMKVFGELPPDWEEKRKYCKWKAADINRALKEGRVPQSGEPQKEQQTPVFNNPPEIQTPGYSNEQTKLPEDLFPESRFSTDSYSSESNHNSLNDPSQFFKQETKQQQFQLPPQPATQAPSQPPTQLQPQIPPLPSTQQLHSSRQQPSRSRATFNQQQRKAVQSAQQLAQRAIGELEFKNIDKAKENLQQALAALNIFNE